MLAENQIVDNNNRWESFCKYVKRSAKHRERRDGESAEKEPRESG